MDQHRQVRSEKLTHGSGEGEPEWLSPRQRDLQPEGKGEEVAYTLSIGAKSTTLDDLK